MAIESEQGKGQFPLNNCAYDVVVMIHEKSKSLEAFDTYMEDAKSDEQLCKALLKMRNDEQRHVEELKGHLQRLLSSQSQSSARH